MLSFTIFDVGHGFCAYAVGPNGTNTLFDCGHDDEIGFRPSQYLPNKGVRIINRMVVSNYDTDHVSDFANLRRIVGIKTFFRNRTISPDQLRRLKLQGGPLSSGVEAVLQMHAGWKYPPVPADYGGVELSTYCNSYPTFTDTNNLSVVSFLEYAGLCIVYPGDLETAGWQELLKDAAFRTHLGRVDVFIASHHGRKNGYCEDVFLYCTPELILISDKGMLYESQENIYAKHARGITWNGDAQQKRFVLTTRCDGNMTLTKEPNHGFHITVGR
jgi:beta-lactamase superfamily II metal-dependent hydrolase